MRITYKAKLICAIIMVSTLSACSASEQATDELSTTVTSEQVTPLPDAISDGSIEKATTCNQDGTSVPVGTQWCRSDAVIWKCKTDGLWLRTGTSCTP